MKILIVDDEPKILDIVEAYLTTKNYQIFRALNGTDAMKKFELIQPNLIILDLMLPDVSGTVICQNIRKSSDIPIIMLTAKSTENDILQGLQIGADDYVVKPFSPKELVARVETVLRRSGSSISQQTKWSFNKGDLIIFPSNKQVLKTQQEVVLTHTEFELLTLLAASPKQIFSREQLLETVKGIEFEVLDRIIDSHIKNLRQKIEDNTRQPYFILTVYGMGYRFGGEKDEAYN
ncbi:DNA-binding response regulator, OmpR family, contains REC and winged-helix (wHTH) domain [Carnobacterium iners]|uniref:DNA-binding response regulator, OmpR family, contains REC and winged-helix (WHTH) domain n=1 Tax=Carnobacterium iners TaxID=1073423 RepID=A0A1X7MV02_9LACT|nr:response regulator transcription factor [Carnobacterium iners]SEK56779.1 DNA-binding response regulator, OmpR family, contains REC and winged-helix (wHTH) domain [Carnobacterium iners]SMH28148.1 DNA-binding response regulator, OmpR family, contains REC and winged-helix (wHTH) domain [Carnobacterium iners]